MSNSTIPYCEDLPFLSFDGNSDIYGLGIRIGLYLGWITSAFSRYFYLDSCNDVYYSYVLFNFALIVSLFVITFEPLVSPYNVDTGLDLRARPAEITIVLFFLAGGTLLVRKSQKSTDVLRPHTFWTITLEVIENIVWVITVLYSLWFWTIAALGTRAFRSPVWPENAQQSGDLFCETKWQGVTGSDATLALSSTFEQSIFFFGQHDCRSRYWIIFLFPLVALTVGAGPFGPISLHIQKVPTISGWLKSGLLMRFSQKGTSTDEKLQVLKYVQENYSGQRGLVWRAVRLAYPVETTGMVKAECIDFGWRYTSYVVKVTFHRVNELDIMNTKEFHVSLAYLPHWKQLAHQDRLNAKPKMEAFPSWIRHSFMLHEQTVEWREDRVKMGWESMTVMERLKTSFVSIWTVWDFAFAILMIVYMIIAVEMQIKNNLIRRVYTIDSIGQLIPFVVGVLGFGRICSQLRWQKKHKTVDEESEVTNSIPLQVMTGERLGPAPHGIQLSNGRWT